MASENSSPNEPQQSMTAFFRQFEARSAAIDIGGLVAMYAPSFLMAGPGGTQVVKASDLALAIPRRKQLFDAAGCRSTTLRAVDETRLDDRYSLVRTEWEWMFQRADGTTTTIAQPSSFVVDRAAGQIVCYMNHADITAAMRERGLLPDPRN